MARKADFDSPFYPFQKVLPGANTLKGAENIPYKLLMYLLDLPDSEGYEPKDDNERARVRLAKYLWHDGARPLEQPLPSPAEKRSMLFDPDHPDINTDKLKEAHPKGYRLFWQRMVGQSQLGAQTVLKCYLGRIFEARKFETTIGIIFEIYVNVNLEANTRTTAYQRSFDIEQCLHEALDGVNMDGVGTISFARQDHLYNGSDPLWDESTGYGRTVHCSITWCEGGGNTVTAY